MTLEEALAASETYDTLVNEVLEIDPINRTIAVPDNEEIFGVYQDRNAERKYFTCPRYVGDMIDLSECYMYVNYLSVGGTYGYYLCDDIAIDGDNITFSWLLSGNVFDTNEDGEIQFSVQAKTTDGESVFGTRIIKAAVYQSVGSEDYVEETYADIITQILTYIGLSTDETSWATPEITVERTEDDDGAVITVTDNSGTYSVTVYDGTDGTDGVSPTVTLTETDDGVQIDVTDVNGTSTATVKNGTDGTDGTDYSIDLEETEDGVTITVTDNAMKTAMSATVSNGTDGTTAYEYAQTAGYTGTEDEFAAILYWLTTLTDSEEVTY